MPARILLIEDNTANLELMVYLLEAYGHMTVSCRDGAAGFEAAVREKPDAIICDVQLPKMTGYEVVRLLKLDSYCRAIPTVAVTALAMVGDRGRVLEAGFDGYLAKPIDPETFVQQVEAFLKVDPSRAAIHAAVEQREAPQRVSRGRILVVDDLPSNLDLARAILQPFGYEVRTANRPQQALEQARLELPDLILSDVCMVESNGFDFIRAVKADARLAGIPFVFITSTMMREEYRAQGLALGAAAFLHRPVEPQELLAAIQCCLLEGSIRGENTGR